MESDTKKLKMLFISSDKYPPFRVDVSVLFGKEIVNRGHQVDWILQSEGDCDKSYITRWKGCCVWVGKTNNGTTRRARLLKHIYSIKNDLLMFKLLKETEYNFVQVKDKFISAIFAIIAAKYNKRKFIFWLSFPYPEAALYTAKIGTARYPLFYLIRGWLLGTVLYRFILPYADHVFVQSEQMKKDLERSGADIYKMTAVPMGVSLDSIKYDKTVVNKESNKILYLGTLAKARRIEFLVDVLKIVKVEIPEAILTLVGEGNDPSDRDVIMDKAKDLDVADSVIITGFLAREKAMSHVEQAGVCVSPFYPTPILNSTSPTKLVEYMAMGKPVVANDHPEQRLVIEESQAGICVPYEEDKFAAAIVTLLKEPKNAAEMGKKGRLYVEKKRSYSRIADDLEKQYYKICSTN